MTTTTLSIRLPVAVSDKLSRIADATRRSRSFLAAEALAAYVDRELAIAEGIQHGLSDVSERRVVPQDRAMALLHMIVDEAIQKG